MTQPRILFAGTPDFAVPPLRTLLQTEVNVVGVYTQPDRPAGRGRKLTPSPVKQVALDHQIPVYQPVTLKEATDQQSLAGLEADLMVVVAYGLLLPKAVLQAPRLGCVNLHASLLPRWRGAAPIQRAVLAGDDQSGVCLMQMDEGLDTGPVLARVTTPINSDETGASLHDRLATLGAELLGEQLLPLLRGELQAMAQPEAGVTYAGKLSKSEAVIDWRADALTIERQVRAFNAWPVAQTLLDDSNLRIWEARALAENSGGAPGAVVNESPEGIDVACGTGTLRLLTLQVPGKRPLSVREFLNANSLAGRKLGG